MGINDCPGDEVIVRDYEGEGGGGIKQKQGEKEGNRRRNTQDIQYIVEVGAATGKLLPRAIVCCVCAGLLFRSLLTSWPSVRRAGKDGRI